MSWSPEIKDAVLVKCGRHCCICHKFCGIKIELHHIILKSENGEELVDNCIHLCFDCHSDQKSYDFKHPKGTKYSTEELKGHREKWYNLVSQNLGTGTIEHLDQDVHLFLKFYNKIPPRPTIWYLRELDFNAKKFKLNNLQAITNLVREIYYEPWMEFFDSDIQALFSELVNYMREFEDLIKKETFPFHDGDINHQCVPRDWENDQPERYKNAVNALNNLGDNIVNTYSIFMSLGRKKLGIIIP